MREGEITGGEFFVAGREPPKIVQLANPVFDFVPGAIEPARTRRGLEAVFASGDHAFDLVPGQPCAQRVGVIGTVGSQPGDPAGRLGFGVDGVEADEIVPLACGQRQRHGGVFVRAGDMQFGRQAAPRAAQSLIRAVFFGAPAACGWTGMLVLSTNTFNNTGVAPHASAAHSPRQTPAASQRRKRM